jgi:hypothetical protein
LASTHPPARLQNLALAAQQSAQAEPVAAAPPPQPSPAEALFGSPALARVGAQLMELMGAQQRVHAAQAQQRVQAAQAQQRVQAVQAQQAQQRQQAAQQAISRQQQQGGWQAAQAQAQAWQGAAARQTTTTAPRELQGIQLSSILEALAGASDMHGSIGFGPPSGHTSSQNTPPHEGHPVPPPPQAPAEEAAPAAGTTTDAGTATCTGNRTAEDDGAAAAVAKSGPSSSCGAAAAAVPPAAEPDVFALALRHANDPDPIKARLARKILEMRQGGAPAAGARAPPAPPPPPRPAYPSPPAPAPPPHMSSLIEHMRGRGAAPAAPQHLRHDASPAELLALAREFARDVEVVLPPQLAPSPPAPAPQYNCAWAAPRPQYNAWAAPPPLPPQQALLQLLQACRGPAPAPIAAAPYPPQSWMGW